MEKNFDPEFPWLNAFQRRGNQQALMNLLREFCSNNAEFQDVASLLPTEPTESDIQEESSSPRSAQKNLDGSVYLLKAGKFYKIGQTKDMGRRNYDLRIQLPQKATLVHQIKTDDPAGIEKYWHTRFAAKRENGEWFSLTPDDVTAFRRRKFMYEGLTSLLVNSLPYARFRLRS